MRVVREHYPVADLPEDLREGFDASASVRVVIEQVERAPEPPMSLDETLAMRRPPYRTTEEIVAEVRRPRDERDDRSSPPSCLRGCHRLH